MSSGSFVVDVCPNDSSESVSGYPRYANNEARAHAMAEEAVRELGSEGKPGEYLVMVCADQLPVATQVVLVGKPVPNESPNLGFDGPASTGVT